MGLVAKKSFFRVTFIFLMCGCLLPVGALGASVYTETFDSDTGGWFSSNTSLSSTTQVLRASIPAYTGPGGDTATYRISAIGISGSTNFVGDYRASGIGLLGFDFRAVNATPSTFVISLRGASNSVQKILTSSVSATGTWYSFRFSMQSAALGAWGGVTGDFDQIMMNVTSLSFSIVRRLTTAENFHFDNIFLDRLPASTAAEPAQVEWSHLRTGEVYRVDVATNLAASPVVWNLVTNFIATNNVFSLPLNTTNENAFYRILMEW